MPLKPISYENTIVYKIVCKDPTIKDCYVGHTTDFIKRKARHKYACYDETNSKYNFKVYRFIRDNGGWDNFNMVLVEKYKCADRLEAGQKEREHIEKLGAQLNSVRAGYTNDEIRRIKAQYAKEYRLRKKSATDVQEPVVVADK